MESEIIEKKSVKERTRDEHLFLIRNKYYNVREYLLSMGNFKDVPIEKD